jgi:DNA-directed RNA polymerase subunit M/transcription elongation factor TFIIS
MSIATAKSTVRLKRRASMTQIVMQAAIQESLYCRLQSGRLQTNSTVPAQRPPIFSCPRCGRPTGRQDKFAVHERDEIKVIVRCTECRHRWSVIVAAGDHADPSPPIAE